MQVLLQTFNELYLHCYSPQPQSERPFRSLKSTDFHSQHFPSFNLHFFPDSMRCQSICFQQINRMTPGEFPAWIYRWKEYRQQTSSKQVIFSIFLIQKQIVRTHRAIQAPGNPFDMPPNSSAELRSSHAEDFSPQRFKPILCVLQCQARWFTGWMPMALTDHGIFYIFCRSHMDRDRSVPLLGPQRPAFSFPGRAVVGFLVAGRKVQQPPQLERPSLGWNHGLRSQPVADGAG